AAAADGDLLDVSLALPVVVLRPDGAARPRWDGGPPGGVDEVGKEELFVTHGRPLDLRSEFLLELDEDRVLLPMIVEEGDPRVEDLVLQVVPRDHQVHGPGPALAEGLPHPAVGNLGQPRVARLIPAGARAGPRPCPRPRPRPGPRPRSGPRARPGARAG